MSLERTVRSGRKSITFAMIKVKKYKVLKRILHRRTRKVRNKFGIYLVPNTFLSKIISKFNNQTANENSRSSQKCFRYHLGIVRTL